MRALLLAQRHRLSDPKAVVASLRRAAAAGWGADGTTPGRFRASLAGSGLAGKVMAEIDRQPDAHGLIPRAGTLIEAGMVDAAVRKPSRA